DRGGRDDGTAARLTHLGHRVLDAEEYGAQQNREAAVPVFRTGFFERSDRAAQACVIIDDIEMSEFPGRAIDRALDVFFTRDVGKLEDRVAAVLPAVAHCGLAALTIKVGNHDRSSFARESNCGGAADSARRTSNDCNLLFEFTHDFSPRCSEARLLDAASCINSRVTATLPTAEMGRWNADSGGLSLAAPRQPRGAGNGWQSERAAPLCRGHNYRRATNATKSPSVRMPTRRRFSTTGRQPIFRSVKIRAASIREVSGPVVTTSVAITSLTESVSRIFR